MCLPRAKFYFKIGIAGLVHKNTVPEDKNYSTESLVLGPTFEHLYMAFRRQHTWLESSSETILGCNSS